MEAFGDEHAGAWEAQEYQWDPYRLDVHPADDSQPLMPNSDGKFGTNGHKGPRAPDEANQTHCLSSKDALGALEDQTLAVLECRRSCGPIRPTGHRNSCQEVL